jgi:hypothetical protein
MALVALINLFSFARLADKARLIGVKWLVLGAAA